jgi:hypothetical protein
MNTKQLGLAGLLAFMFLVLAVSPALAIPQPSSLPRTAQPRVTYSAISGLAVPFIQNVGQTNDAVS